MGSDSTEPARPMIHWFVTTPTYAVREYEEHMLAQVYDASDFEEIDATTRREAVSLAVKQWLASGTGRYSEDNYCQRQRSDGLSPYTGVRAQSEDEARQEVREQGPPDWEPDFCDVESSHAGATHWVWIEHHSDPDLRWGWFGTCDEHDPSKAKASAR